MIFFYLCPWFRQADTFAFVVSCHYNNILVIDIMILKHPVIFMRHGWLCIVTHKIKSSQCKNNFTFSLNFNDMGLITQLCHLSSSSNKNYCKMFNCVYLACLSVVLALPPPHEYPTPAPAPVVPQSRPHSDCHFFLNFWFWGWMLPSPRSTPTLVGFPMVERFVLGD